jgi:hypothetical protein
MQDLIHFAQIKNSVATKKDDTGKTFVLRKEKYMIKIFCPYCGEPLASQCNCEFEAALELEEMIDRIEERQHDNGFYTFQDLLDAYRRER